MEYLLGFMAIIAAVNNNWPLAILLVILAYLFKD